jgi:hypothetical protein
MAPHRPCGSTATSPGPAEAAGPPRATRRRRARRRAGAGRDPRPGCGVCTCPLGPPGGTGCCSASGGNCSRRSGVGELARCHLQRPTTNRVGTAHPVAAAEVRWRGRHQRELARHQLDHRRCPRVVAPRREQHRSRSSDPPHHPPALDQQLTHDDRCYEPSIGCEPPPPRGEPAVHARNHSSRRPGTSDARPQPLRPIAPRLYDTARSPNAVRIRPAPSAGTPARSRAVGAAATKSRDCSSSFDAQGGSVAAGSSAAMGRRQGWAGSTCAVV